MKWTFILLAAVVSSTVTVTAADNAHQSFVKAWTGQAVVVRNPLYSLVFNERGKLGSTKNGVREGLVVATPSLGIHYQFDGRQGRDEVIERDIQRMVAAVNSNYEPDSLDVRPYRKVEPVVINRYDPGVQLVVNEVRIEKDLVTLGFAVTGETESVTSIRVKWPTPLSKLFTERALVETLIRQFVLEIKP